MGFSGSRLLKKLGKQFNIVIVSIGSILVLFCFIWYSWRFQETLVGFVQFQKCVLSKPFFSLEFMYDETCLNVESSRILEKGTLVCRNVGGSK